MTVAPTASVGAVAVMDVALTVTEVAETVPKVTPLATLRFVPPIVIVVPTGPAYGAIAGPHRVVGGGGATADDLIALHLPRPGRRPGCLRRTGRAGAC